MAIMTARERVEAVLRGEWPDRIPFTVYREMLPQCEAERYLRNKGLCIILEQPSVYDTVSPNVTRERLFFSEEGSSFVRTEVRTPKGDLCSVERFAPDEDATWHASWLFGGPEDYPAIESMVRDQQYVPNYEAFEKAQQTMGGDGFVRPDLGYSPLQEIIYSLMGVETFAVEWAERQDDVLRLYDALTENRRRLYEVVAKSPALAANYCGNVSSEVIGPERFRKYYVPHYNEFAEIMHAHGKVVGAHFDANTWALAEAISETEIDYVEALTPRPDSDMSVAEARTVWPGKILWLNFPPSFYPQGTEALEKATRQILWEAAPGDRFLLGVTEEVPEDCWQEGFAAIQKVINREGLLPIQWKSLSRRG